MTGCRRRFTIEREGYYCRSDLPRWGREGDYRTSPERSPLFAATFARYFAALDEELVRRGLYHRSGAARAISRQACSKNCGAITRRSLPRHAT